MDYCLWYEQWVGCARLAIKGLTMRFLSGVSGLGEIDAAYVAQQLAARQARTLGVLRGGAAKVDAQLDEISGAKAQREDLRRSYGDVRPKSQTGLIVGVAAAVVIAYFAFKG